MAELTPEQRDWDEYLAWTRGANPGQYEITEERAWRRLEDARRAVALPRSSLCRPSLEEPDEIEDAGFDRGF